MGDHSSDLWVAGVVKDAKDTGKKAGVDYAIGAASGPVKTAQVKFLGYTIDDQAFSAYSFPRALTTCMLTTTPHSRTSADAREP